MRPETVVRVGPGSSSASLSIRLSGLCLALMVLCGLCAASSVHAEGPSITLELGQGGPKQTAVVLQILALLTVLSLAPAMFIMVTSFTRMVIVLSFLRQALGTQQVPPNQVLISLALFLTMFVMAPVGEAVYKDAVQPLLAEQIGYDEAWNKVSSRFAPLCSSRCETRISNSFSNCRIRRSLPRWNRSRPTSSFPHLS